MLRLDRGADPADVARAVEHHGACIASASVDPQLVSSLVAAVDSAVSAERTYFPEGDAQDGRLLFAPHYGGAFLDLIACEEVMAPIELVVGSDSILYTMTTSVLRPGSSGPVSEFHTDLDPALPRGLSVAAIVLLDEFSSRTGATEFASTAGPTAGSCLLIGRPGDVCFFDPRRPHRSTLNSSALPRRAVVFSMVKPWMKQRVDVRAMVEDRGLAPEVRRRLGLTSVPPASISEFIGRRRNRPW